VHSATHVYEASAVAELCEQITRQNMSSLIGQRQYVEYDIGAADHAHNSVRARVGYDALQLLWRAAPAANVEALTFERQRDLPPQLTKAENANRGVGRESRWNERPLVARLVVNPVTGARRDEIVGDTDRLPFLRSQP